MKMTYLLHAKRSRKNHTSAFFIVLFLCLFIAFFARGVIVRNFAYMSNALGGMFYSILPQGFRTANYLAQENLSLRNQISTLTASNADRNVLANENERLKSGLERKDKEKIVYATILKRPPESLYDTFILDAGISNAVAVDDVVASGSVAIGKIVEVGNGYSKARLFSSSGNSFEGTLSENVHIEAKGVGGGAFEVTAPLGVAASLGDALILPEISSKIYGLVQSIEEKPDEGFKRILFALPINPNQIDSVSIIVK